MNSARRWINTRVVIDMLSGAVLSKSGFFYTGPVAAAEGKTPEQLATELAAAQKTAEEAVAEAAKLRKTNTELTGKVMTPEQQKRLTELEAAAALAEEDKKKKAGEWDTLRTELTTKHGTELKQRDDLNATLTERFKRTVVTAEFGRASDLFGGDTAKTILDVDLALAALGGYVHVEDDATSPLGYKVVVKKANGTPIVGSDGMPKPFGEAMVDLITSLPNKDRILRGSGKTGSGSPGGPGSYQQDIDLDTLIKKAAGGDPDAIKKLKERQAGIGAMTKGSAFKS